MIQFSCTYDNIGNKLILPAAGEPEKFMLFVCVYFTFSNAKKNILPHLIKFMVLYALLDQATGHSNQL